MPSRDAVAMIPGGRTASLDRTRLVEYPTAVTLSTETITPRILIFGLSREDGRIPGAELYRVGEACGLGRERLRSCLRRLVGEGFVERGARSSRAAGEYQLSETGKLALRRELARYRRAYERDEHDRWDGRWHLAAFTLGEDSRDRRDQLRDFLVALGGVRLMGGLYLSAFAWEDAVRERAKSLGVESMITLSSTTDLEVGGERDPVVLAARFWPVDSLEVAYRSFVARFEPAVEALEALRDRNERLEDAVFLPAAIEMSVAFQDCFARDPLLPRELLPSPWSGAQARELLLESRRLALSLREKAQPPALFGLFDETTRDLGTRTGPGGRSAHL